jgi:hypothetical protein
VNIFLKSVGERGEFIRAFDNENCTVFEIVVF